MRKSVQVRPAHSSSIRQDSDMHLSQSASPQHATQHLLQSFVKVPDMKIPRKGRLFLAEGIKKNFLGGLGFLWAPRLSQFLGKGEVV